MFTQLPYACTHAAPVHLHMHVVIACLPSTFPRGNTNVRISNAAMESILPCYCCSTTRATCSSQLPQWHPVAPLSEFNIDGLGATLVLSVSAAGAWGKKCIALNGDHMSSALTRGSAFTSRVNVIRWGLSETNKIYSQRKIRKKIE